MKEQRTDPVGDSLRRIPGEVRKFVEKRLELFLIEVSEKGAGLLAETTARIVGGAMLGLGCFMGLLALAIYIGELLGSASLGLITVGFPLILFGWIVMSMKTKGLVRSIRDHYLTNLVDTLAPLDDGTDKPKLPLPHQEAGSGKKR